MGSFDTSHSNMLPRRSTASLCCNIKHIFSQFFATDAFDKLKIQHFQTLKISRPRNAITVLHFKRIESAPISVCVCRKCLCPKPR